jgi:hypothetical protein
LSRENIAWKFRSPLTGVLALITVIAIMVSVSACASGVTLYKRGGVAIAIPKEYADQLLIVQAQADDERILITLKEKSTHEKYPGMGLLFSIVRYTEAQYEQFLASDGSGLRFFAKDDRYYYGFMFPTDMQAYDYELYAQLLESLRDFIESDFLKRNRLTPYDDSEFFGRTYTYDGEHVFMKYYPYYVVNGKKDEVWTLCLSQPVKQGEGGIWCVERWRDQYGNIYPYFPDADGVPSGEYYAALQAGEDARRQDPQFDLKTSWFDPEYAALQFIKEVFGPTPSAGSLERIEGSLFAEELFSRPIGWSTFSLGIPGPRSWDVLSLSAYPVDFPFGVDLTGTSRESFEAEDLGQVTIVESDGFQLKYLHDFRGVYVVYCIRTTREGHFNKGISVGDPEEKLWDHWQPEQLRKMDRLSHEDEDWFGENYDHGYVYAPEESTRSVVYLVKDGRVAGIGLVDGIFGSMY